jgi:hypothetical protein
MTYNKSNQSKEVENQKLKKDKGGLISSLFLMCNQYIQ